MAPLELALWRVVFAWPAFAVGAALTGSLRPARDQLTLIIAYGVVGVAGMFGLYALAVRLCGVSLSSALLYTAPVWVVLVRYVRTRADPGRSLICALLALTGIVGLFMGSDAPRSGPDGVRGPLIGLGAGLCFAACTLIGARAVKRMHATTLHVYAFPLAALLLLPFVELGPRPTEAWLAAAAAGVGSTGLGFLAYSTGLRTVAPDRAAVLTTLDPVIAIAIASSWLGEQLSALAWTGCAAVVTAAGLALAPSRRDSKRRHSKRSGSSGVGTVDLAELDIDALSPRVVLQHGQAVLAPQARVLHAAEGHGHRGDVVVVDPADSGLQASDHTVGATHRWAFRCPGSPAGPARRCAHAARRPRDSAPAPAPCPTSETRPRSPPERCSRRG